MRLLALLLTAALAALVAGPAGAADPTPTYSGCGKAVKDASGDATEQAGTAPDQVDLTGAFVNADQNTVNLIVKNLDGTVPPPYSSITYDATYGSADASLFVRAFLDFTGSVVFEYGHLDSSTPLKRYQRDGDTKGNLFKGANGVVQITVPPEAGGKPGTQLKGIIAETQTGEATFVPGAAPTPSRGISVSSDTAGLGNVTLGPCAETPATPAPGPAPAPSSSTTTTTQQAGPLPVKLASKSVKHAKKGKAVKVKLKTSEPLTQVGVRISKGTKAYGTGSLAKLAKTGTVKVKLTSALKKGTYSFDVAGTDSKGARRVGSLKLRVK